MILLETMSKRTKPYIEAACCLKNSFGQNSLVNCGLKPSNLIQSINTFHLTNKAKIQNSKIEICPSSLSSTTMTNSTMPVLSTTLPYTCFTPLSTISSSLNQRKMSLYTNTLLIIHWLIFQTFLLHKAIMFGTTMFLTCIYHLCPC